MQARLITTPAYELTAELHPTPLGTLLAFSSLVPTARRPETQRRFHTMLDRDGLVALRTLIDTALAQPAG